MSDKDFFEVFFSNLPLFGFFMSITTCVLYLNIRRVVPAGYLDPFHFYWTFTFGTSYGIVISLYFLNYISDYIFFIILIYGFSFVFFFHLFIRMRINPLENLVNILLIPKGRGFFEFCCILIVYILSLILVLWLVGAGMFAADNRFEQNRGFGALVRLADALRPFVIGYFSLIIVKKYKEQKKINIGTILLSCSLILLIILGAVVNGAKFSVLEAIYSIFLVISIYYSKIKFKFLIAFVVLSFSLVFALMVLSKNLDKSGFDRDAGSQYMRGDFVLLERLILRVLANGDVYYFSLPNNVIEVLKTDSALVRFASSFVGVTSMSKLLGYPVDDYSIGRQSILYFDPALQVAGGPTSHFDLFSYKYFGFEFGIIFIIFIAFLFSCLLALTKTGQNKMFYSALVAALWLRFPAVLLEPPIGLAYVFDIFILFFVLKLFGSAFKKKNLSNVY